MKTRFPPTMRRSTNDLSHCHRMSTSLGNKHKWQRGEYTLVIVLQAATARALLVVAPCADGYRCLCLCWLFNHLVVSEDDLVDDQSADCRHEELPHPASAQIRAHPVWVRRCHVRVIT